MNDLRTVAQQALEAWQTSSYGQPSHQKAMVLAMTALRATLAESVQAESITDAMMDIVDRLGSEYDQVDPRAWQHLLVYAPKTEPVQESTCAAPLACSGIDKCVFRYNTQFPVVKTPPIGCDVCGLSGSKVSQVMSYVCPRGDCPTKVTC